MRMEKFVQNFDRRNSGEETTWDNYARMGG